MRMTAKKSCIDVRLTAKRSFSLGRKKTGPFVRAMEHEIGSFKVHTNLHRVSFGLRNLEIQRKPMKVQWR